LVMLIITNILLLLEINLWFKAIDALSKTCQKWATTWRGSKLYSDIH
jgi:hypothetical protein